MRSLSGYSKDCGGLPGSEDRWLSRSRPAERIPEADEKSPCLCGAARKRSGAGESYCAGNGPLRTSRNSDHFLTGQPRPRAGANDDGSGTAVSLEMRAGFEPGCFEQS